MDFVKPNENGFTVYTKTGCSYCIKAKILLSNYRHSSTTTIIECDEYIDSSRNDFLEFIKIQTGIEYKTFPIIFHNGKFIGGYTELKIYIDKESAFNMDTSF